MKSNQDSVWASSIDVHWHFNSAYVVRLLQSQPRGGHAVCSVAAVLGLGTEGVVRARPVGRSVCDVAPDPVAGGTARGGTGGWRVVVGLAPWGGAPGGRALPALVVVDCAAGACWDGSVVDGASPCVG